MLGKIEIEGMEFYAHHGCYETERRVGGKFTVDLYIEADCDKASETDNIEDACNYQRAYEIIKEEIAITSNLLENVCKRMLDSLYKNVSGIKKARVKVSKMNPPMGGQILKTSLTLER